ncbi:hypothetical protein M409DRAFT_27079 [Zasmidium cellare ATCC 36951]|uniref:Uncharacterized protein n=1 Tax=Zasmidium cellare ATCC 36951 TaxID=1080233 RepID=A0A6A6C612_ZASCE|nr:uncharacterized protein M409DRAFT_27079 [Zasmidium cellare ATCC 36951]KAF2162455.1 hypothetical protein M409DRAFT_27079 [Zasmidium cellare ATCC 36951]
MGSNADLAAKFESVSNEAVKALKGSNSAEREEVLREGRRLVQQLQTPADYALRMVWAPVELSAAAAACEMGIFASLAQGDKPMTTAEIARSSEGGDVLLVQRIVQALAAHGLIDQTDEQHYLANDITRDFTTPGRHGSAMTQMFSMRAYSALPWFLRKNGYKSPASVKECCWQEVYEGDGTIWEWMKENPEMGKYFNDYMAAARPYTSSALVEEFPFEKLFEGSTGEEIVFVDVGGGHGHQALSLRKSFPPERGRMILQDLPQVAEGKSLEGVEVMVHDMFKEQPIKGARAYYFRGVLHDHDDPVCQDFLKQIVKVMGPDSRLLVHDAIIEDFMPSIQSVRQDLGLMCLFAGRERTKAQMKALLESVGLTVVATYKAGPEKWSVTEARLS